MNPNRTVINKIKNSDTIRHRHVIPWGPGTKPVKKEVVEKEVIKEVPKEVIKEVPKEVIKEKVITKESGLSDKDLQKLMTFISILIKEQLTDFKGSVEDLLKDKLVQQVIQQKLQTKEGEKFKELDIPALQAKFVNFDTSKLEKNFETLGEKTEKESESEKIADLLGKSESEED